MNNCEHHTLRPQQVDQLLKAIDPSRVLKLQGKMSYVAQHDIRAHMSRIFGFGNWSTQVIETAPLYEFQDTNSRWKVGYRATVRVSIDCPQCGHPLATYEDSAASENAPQPSKGDAHHLALTTAVSTAFKRACTNLGDQYGLSLYEKGQTAAFVKGTLVRPTGGTSSADLPVSQVTSHGEETPDEPTEAPSQPVKAPVSHAEPHPVGEDVEAFLQGLREARNLAEPAEKLARVGALKARYKDLLQTPTTMKDGSTVTLGRLSDTIATDALVSGSS